MKIIFLCGSLEPGRDGVGDYVRRLGGELIRQGHKAAAIAFNDKYVVVEEVDTQGADDVEFPTYRVPASFDEKFRFERVRQWISEFEPQWISLQYVPFAFNKKGLPFGLSDYLKPLGKGRKWHFMFHELWVGMADSDSFKLTIWGLIQKRLISSLLTNLNPTVVHTQSCTYQLYLQQMYPRVELLPLISNIFTNNLISSISNKYKPSLKTGHNLNFVVFGTIHKNALIEQFTGELTHFVKKSNSVASLTIVGRWSAEQIRWANVWKSNELSVSVLGEQSVEQVSQTLGKATFGLSSTAYAVIEKSGSVAAMLAHKIPVICIAQPWKPRGIKNVLSPLGVTEYKPGNLNFQLEQASRNVIPNFTVSNIAHQFINSLLSSSDKTSIQ